MNQFVPDTELHSGQAAPGTSDPSTRRQDLESLGDEARPGPEETWNHGMFFGPNPQRMYRETVAILLFVILLMILSFLLVHDMISMTPKASRTGCSYPTTCS